MELSGHSQASQSPTYKSRQHWYTLRTLLPVFDLQVRFRPVFRREDRLPGCFVRGVDPGAALPLVEFALLAAFVDLDGRFEGLAGQFGLDGGNRDQQNVDEIHGFVQVPV
jgi:hypothetical protein